MDQTHQVGEHFYVHFVWRLPGEGDVIRAVFEADVLAIIEAAMKYMVRLDRFVAGRQESGSGDIIRPKEELNAGYWQNVAELEGRKITIAWEVADGRPVYLRLATLTGEHDFFRRYNQEWSQGNLPQGFKIRK